MKIFVVWLAVATAVTALPTDKSKNGVIGYVSDVIIDAANFTDGRIPHGQAGFAAMNGGTTGGAGGSTWTVWDPWALRDAIGHSERRVVYVRGRIDLTPLFTSSPGVRLSVARDTSVIGGDNNAMIFGGGLRVLQNNVIIQNIKFHNALSYAPGEQPDGNGGILAMVHGDFSEVDNIGIERAEHVWVDHCEFADDPWIALNTPGNMRRHDGLIDIIRGANWITISNNIFRNHDPVMLVGHADTNAAQDVGRLKVTYYLNWFQGTVQRNPRVRFGEVHVLNNLYTDIHLLAIGAGVGALIYGERNVFINTPRAWGFINANTNPMGYFMNVENRLINSNYDWGVPSYGVTWRPSNYYWYSAMDVNNVEGHVRTYAGTW